MAKVLKVRNADNTGWDEIASSIPDVSTYLTINSASVTYATKEELDNIDLAGYAPIVDPVFTNNVQIEGDLKFDVVDGTAKGLIGILNGPGYDRLQVYTPKQLGLYAEENAFLIANSIVFSGTDGEFLNSSGSANQIATIGDINSLSDIYQEMIPYSSSTPSSPVTGDLWVDSSTNPPALKTYNGSSWVQLGSAVDDAQAIIAASMFMG